MVQPTSAMGLRAVCLFLLASSLAVDGLYFHISETERKCFIEEVPAETMIVGRHYCVHVSCSN